MPEWFESVPAAADVLAKVACASRRVAEARKEAAFGLDTISDAASRAYGNASSWLGKQDPMARDALIGGGVGALAGGVGGLGLGYADRKRRNPLTTALTGALSGGALGAGGAALYHGLSDGKSDRKVEKAIEDAAAVKAKQVSEDKFNNLTGWEAFWARATGVLTGDKTVRDHGALGARFAGKGKGTNPLNDRGGSLPGSGTGSGTGEGGAPGRNGLPGGGGLHASIGAGLGGTIGASAAETKLQLEAIGANETNFSAGRAADKPSKPTNSTERAVASRLAKLQVEIDGERSPFDITGPVERNLAASKRQQARVANPPGRQVGPMIPPPNPIGPNPFNLNQNSYGPAGPWNATRGGSQVGSAPASPSSPVSPSPAPPPVSSPASPPLSAGASPGEQREIRRGQAAQRLRAGDEAIKRLRASGATKPGGVKLPSSAARLGRVVGGGFRGSVVGGVLGYAVPPVTEWARKTLYGHGPAK